MRVILRLCPTPLTAQAKHVKGAEEIGGRKSGIFQPYKVWLAPGGLCPRALEGTLVMEAEKERSQGGDSVGVTSREFHICAPASRSGPGNRGWGQSLNPGQVTEWAGQCAEPIDSCRKSTVLLGLARGTA